MIRSFFFSFNCPSTLELIGSCWTFNRRRWQSNVGDYVVWLCVLLSFVFNWTDAPTYLNWVYLRNLLMRKQHEMQKNRIQPMVVDIYATAAHQFVQTKANNVNPFRNDVSQFDWWRSKEYLTRWLIPFNGQTDKVKLSQVWYRRLSIVHSQLLN